MADKDYGPKTGAADDHPYKAGETPPADAPAGRKSKVPPPDGHQYRFLSSTMCECRRHGAETRSLLDRPGTTGRVGHPHSAAITTRVTLAASFQGTPCSTGR